MYPPVLGKISTDFRLLSWKFPGLQVTQVGRSASISCFPTVGDTGGESQLHSNHCVPVCLDTLQIEVLIHVTHAEGPALPLSLDQVTNVPLCCIPQYNREIVIVFTYMCATVLHGMKTEKIYYLLTACASRVHKNGWYILLL